MKRRTKVILVISSLIMLFLTYQLYWGDKRLALMLNLGHSLPKELYRVDITERRGPFEPLIGDGYVQASCYTSKESLMEWLKSKGFQLLHFKGDSTRQFITHYADLPKCITDCQVDFIIQYPKKTSDPALINVYSLDENLLRLELQRDWD